LAASTPPLGTTTVLTNAMVNTISADVHAADATLDAALATHRIGVSHCRFKFEVRWKLSVRF
jgi:hypothetical protein